MVAENVSTKLEPNCHFSMIMLISYPHREGVLCWLVCRIFWPIIFKEI